MTFTLAAKICKARYVNATPGQLELASAIAPSDSPAAAWNSLFCNILRVSSFGSISCRDKAQTDAPNHCDMNILRDSIQKNRAPHPEAVLRAKAWQQRQGLILEYFTSKVSAIKILAGSRMIRRVQAL
jgi:hypothetical protein